jgi:hypothetical protein
MGNKNDIKKEWKTPSLDKLEMIRTLGGGTQDEGFGMTGADENVIGSNG